MGLKRNAAWSSFAVVATSFIRFVVATYLARELTPSENGLFVLGVFVAEFAAVASALGVHQTLATFAVKLDDRQKVNLFFWGMRRVLIGVLIISPAAIMLLADAGLGVVPAVMLVHGTILLAWITSILVCLQRFKRLAIVNSGVSVLTLAAVLLSAQSATVDGILALIASINIVVALAQLAALYVEFRYSKGGGLQISKEEINSYAWYAWGAATVSMLIWNRAEIFFLERLVGLDEVAYFAVSLTYVTPVVLALSMVNSVLVPHFAGRSEEGRVRDYLYLTKIALVTSIGGAALLAAAADDAVPLIFGTKYLAAVPTAKLLAVCAGLGFANVGSSVQYATRQVQFVFLTGLLGALLLGATLMLSVPEFGSVGAATARLGVQAVLILWGTRHLCRSLDCRFPLREMLFVASVAALLFSGFCIFRAHLAVSTMIGLPVLAVVGAAAVYFGPVFDSQERGRLLTTLRVSSPR